MHYSFETLAYVKTIDPTPLLMNKGFTITHTGRSFVVYSGNVKLVRLSHMQDDSWLWISHEDNVSGGDNIKLLQFLLKISFAEAVDLLLANGHGLTSVSSNQHPQPVKAPLLRPQLKQPTAAQIQISRTYLLEQRGISKETVAFAERTLFIRYGYSGVVFCGYDETNQLRSAEFRASVPTAPVQKLVLKGSNKKYPPILQGNINKIWIVEGGVDALALRDIALRQSEDPPLTIVSGGAGVSGFIRMPHIQAILRQAFKITIALDHEKNDTIQSQTNALHHKQFDEVCRIVGQHCRVCTYMPPHDKDLADLNLRLTRIKSNAATT